MTPQLACTRCGQATPDTASSPLDNPHLDERAQPRKVCYQMPPAEPGSGEPDPATEAAKPTVRVTANRVIIDPECRPDAASALNRERTDLTLAHHVTCPRYRTQWRVDFLAQRRYGLRVAWRPR
ncbi:MAG: hypothetical protein ACRDZO_24270 [Egibacteraceae bacterium]